MLQFPCNFMFCKYFCYNASRCEPSDSAILQRDTLWINTAKVMFNLYMFPSLLRVNRHTDVSILVRGYGKSWEASKHTFVYYTVNRTWNNKTLLYTLEGLAVRFVRSKPTPKIPHKHRHQHTAWGTSMLCSSKEPLFTVTTYTVYV